MRLFLAINLPPELRDGLWTATRELRGSGLPIRWVGADQLHITLKFLGEVAEDRASRIASATRMAAEGSEPLTLAVGGVGAFPSLRSPRVVWIGVQESGQLADLHGRLEERLLTLGFERETRRFHPHVTLGRVKRGARRPELGELERLATGVRAKEEFRAETLDLMRSQLGPGGARYSLVHAASLGGAKR